MKWTNEQREAIELREKNILVSAAAGSGKTAVLVERIKRLIIDENFSVDRMLIVTFTNLAASEMKAKIRSSLQQTHKAETNIEKKEYLQKQISLLSRANISTFHSFALEVMSDFYYTIDLDPSFKICDDAERTILKRESLDNLFDEFFDNSDDDFIYFLNCYSSEKNEEAIKENIAQIYETICSLPYPWNFVESSIKKLALPLDTFLESDNMQKIWKITNDNITKAITSNEEAINILLDLPILQSKLISHEKIFYDDLYKASKNQDAYLVKELLDNFKASILKATKEEKEEYNQIKKLVTTLRDIGKSKIKEIHTLIFNETFDEHIRIINETHKMGLVLQKLLIRYDELFIEAKRKKGLIDFNDIEHHCFEILKNEEAKDYYQSKFEHIFVDEYQDTNILQEAIVNRIRRPNNLFMVGDIKQSIYKFRLAEPNIFKDKYKNYKSGDDIFSQKIDLNKNYRSKGSIIKYVNTLFENIMEGYDDDAKLYEGIISEKAIPYTPELRLLLVDDIIADNEDLEDYKAAELEATEVCRVIKEYIGKPYFDTKNQEIKTFQKKDIVILVRSAKNYADVFYKILKESGIDAHIDDTDGYLDTVEINLMLNLLMVINNRFQDIPFLAILYSSIFDYSLTELGEIRKFTPKGSFVDAFVIYSEVDSTKNQNSGVDEHIPSLATKCKDTLARIDKWRKSSQYLPLDEFLWQLLKETDYYIIAGAMPKGLIRQGNLRTLIEKAREFQSKKGASLYTFVKYIETVKERKVSMPQVKQPSKNDDIVRIMTIHKSKGLEFPVVILPGISRKKKSSDSFKFNIHKDIGIGLPFVDIDQYVEQDTLIQNLISKQSSNEEYEEEERIFYVALTRPKDALIMIGTIKDYDEFIENKEYNLADNKSFLNMTTTKNIDCQFVDTMISDSPPQINDKININSNYTDIDKEIQNEVDRRLNYKYYNLLATKAKSKYSVSELNSMNVSNKASKFISLKKPDFMMEKTDPKITAAQKGNIYHKILQRIDFTKDCDLASIAAQCELLVETHEISELELAQINIPKICDFLSSYIGKRLRNSANKNQVYKEVPFTMIDKITVEDTLIQGIIDCYFIEDDEIVLLDYKSNYMDMNNLESEKKRIFDMYETQLKLYRKALEESLGKKVKETYIYMIEYGISISC